MKKRLLLFIFFVISIVLSSQYTLKKIPSDFIRPTEDVAISEVKQSTTTDLWVVYSCKHDNHSYWEIGEDNIKRTFDFLEWFYVIDETNDHLHIVKDDPGYSDQTTKEMKDYGWIEKENLLLWEQCLVTNNNISKKVMILNTLRSSLDTSLQHDRVIFYTDPELTNETENISDLYQVFFIYKKSGNSVLVGKDAINTHPDIIEENIKGWVPDHRIVNWDHRVAIEPNWKKDAVQERKDNNIKTSVFIDEPAAIRFKNGNQILKQQLFWDKDPYENRNIGDWRRYPVLVENDNGIIKCNIMGEVFSANGSIDKISFAEIQKKYADRREGIRNINIVFVIDGTTSMGPYFNSISSAINSSMRDLEESFIKNTLRFAIVVYRDKASGDSFLIQDKELCSYTEAIDFLSSISAGYDASDPDYAEAVNYGLHSSLRNIELDQNQTNIIILVGDAGNHSRNDDTQISSETIKNLMQHYLCNFFVFQVHKGSSNTYHDFISQNQTIMMNVAQNEYNNIMIIPNAGKIKPPKFSEVIFKKYKKHELKDSAIFGLVLESRENNFIEPIILENEIKEFVKYTNEHVNKICNLTSQIEGDGMSIEEVDYSSNSPYVNTYKPAVLSFIKSYIQDKEMLDKMTKDRYQLAINAYTVRQIDSMTSPLYKDVIFMDKREFSEVVNILGKFEIAKTSSEQRESMHDVWLEVLKGHLGDRSREYFENMTLSDINSQVFGLPSTSGFLSNVRLIDITDPSRFSDEDFRRYKDGLDNSYKELNAIFNSENFIYKFSSNDITYYWIDMDLLP